MSMSMSLEEIANRRKEIYIELQPIIRLKRDIDARITKGIKPLSVEFEGQAVPLTREVIQRRTQGMVQEIIRDLPSESYPLVISVLNGAAVCSAMLNTALIDAGLLFQADTIQVKSYHGTASTSFEITMLPKNFWAGRDVIIVDDVGDSGKTFHKLKEYFLDGDCKANSVRCVAYIDKAQNRDEWPNGHPDYVGFTLPAESFIMGFGMDYDELGRNHPDIGKIDLETLPNAEEKLILAREKTLNGELGLLAALEKQLLAQEQLVVSSVKQSMFHHQSANDTEMAAALPSQTVQEAEGSSFATKP